VHTGFWWGNLLVRDYLEDPGLDGRIILKHALKTWNGGCGLGWSVSTVTFCKMQGIVLVAGGLLASRDGLSSVALGSCH